ncbi:hypothetical protein KXQ82_02565 [Mucilaginibacter sp. HMF5004]|uniref:hypothetical protein n=1 Tax=Mucilaginibacter rivuli TaxID=2857527 RepID=UPI001C5E5332|nr:hypothetical protein [Mucilaginibacter rivuli]MBW4888575.1 hypothetical protein [Mucilaginibacter rivuli]
MYTQTEKRNSAAAQQHANIAGPQGKVLPAVPVQRKQAVLQMAAPPAGEMNAAEGHLDASLVRKQIVDLVYSKIKKEGTQYKLTSLVAAKRYLVEEADGAAFRKFQAADDGEQTAMTKELMARLYHDAEAVKEITPEMRDNLGRGLDATTGEGEISDPDIAASTTTKGAVASNMTTGKACVITALMFAEGGGVLGARSVEELHFILSTRFKSTWRHYSEDAVFKSLYEHLGYTKTTPPLQRSLENLGTTVGAVTVGMASIGGHMVGFKKDGTDLYIRDNDEGLKKVAAHNRKTEIVVDYWHK